MRIILFILTLFLFLNCGKKQEQQTISDEKLEKFIEVYQDYLLATTKPTDKQEKEFASTVFDSILNQHNFTKEEFISTIEYFKTQPKKFEDILKDLNMKM